ncbi:DUF1460 domain-containing protein [candidate division KSB1 bacterium]|nr:DUF1460 domain-containing protein [candidate division KSB1 bacterium]
MKNIVILSCLGTILFLSSCGLMRPAWKDIELSEDEIKTCQLLNVEDEQIKKLIAKPLYKFSENDVNIYLKYLYNTEYNLRDRIQHLARKGLNQPYQIYLLGEYPFELYDPDPLFNLEKSDCVVFSEHIYAMALAYDWDSFFAFLQRIRYKNGEISYVTRNHFTEYDWDLNNSWLIHDITTELVGDDAASVSSVIDKYNFFRRVGISTFFIPDTFKWSYVPYASVDESLLAALQPGDFVNIVRGTDEENVWVGHVGMITKDDDGTTNFLHSTSPKVVEEPLLNYLQRSIKLNEERRITNQKVLDYNTKILAENSDAKLKQPLPYFLGFKFFRLNEDPVWELFKIDGFDAPKVSIPSGY